jgi:multidrug efflux pump subunit AcrA (membrane-fusion protein)
MRIGLQAGLHFAERPNKVYPATIVSTADALDPTTRTLLTQLEVDNSNGELFPGSYTEVHFQVPPAANVVRIPATALIFRGDGLLVATPTPDSHVELKEVKVGRDFGMQLEIVAGLEPGARIVINPPDSIQQNQLVRIIDAPAGRFPNSQGPNSQSQGGTAR